MLFAVGTVALLGSVYLQAATYLNQRVDGILRAEAEALVKSRPATLRQQIGLALELNGEQTNIFAIFSGAHSRLAGNLRAWPAHLSVNSRPIEAPPTAGFPAYARLMAFPLPNGDILVVGRDVRLTRELRAIIAAALVWSGASIIIMGMVLGFALSLAPLRRLQRMQAIAQDIAAGDLKRRMPLSNRGDELDIVAATINVMIGEVERLMTEVKSATDTVAHDLRTPLTHVRARLHRLQESHSHDPGEVQRLTLEVDEVLERFRALMRISELESTERRSGFADVGLADIAGQIVELYRPLAEAAGATLLLVLDAEPRIHADGKLVFEAVSNLVDNALKFSGPGARVSITVSAQPGGASLAVEDDGPGVPDHERATIIGRFYRAERTRMIPGSGLGLSVVAAIVRLHRFHLRFESADPGLRAVLDCF